MKTWKQLVEEVEEVGFEKASSAARLAWACETGNGIDQHAAPDLKELFDTIAHYQRLQAAAREVIKSRGDDFIGLGMTAQERKEILDALAKELNS